MKKTLYIALVLLLFVIVVVSASCKKVFPSDGGYTFGLVSDRVCAGDTLVLKFTADGREYPTRFAVIGSTAEGARLIGEDLLIAYAEGCVTVRAKAYIDGKNREADLTVTVGASPKGGLFETKEDFTETVIRSLLHIREDEYSNPYNYADDYGAAMLLSERLFEGFRNAGFTRGELNLVLDVAKKKSELFNQAFKSYKANETDREELKKELLRLAIVFSDDYLSLWIAPEKSARFIVEYAKLVFSEKIETYSDSALSLFLDELREKTEFDLFSLEIQYYSGVLSETQHLSLRQKILDAAAANEEYYQKFYSAECERYKNELAYIADEKNDFVGGIESLFGGVEGGGFGNVIGQFDSYFSGAASVRLSRSDFEVVKNDMIAELRSFRTKLGGTEELLRATLHIAHYLFGIHIDGNLASVDYGELAVLFEELFNGAEERLRGLDYDSYNSGEFAEYVRGEWDNLWIDFAARLKG
ncbi:MAG: hypothetical protein LBT20_01315 [Clostridiales bacterium]|jgi:hypothetical protein|nr:hypothetical protein [Clostridiales bacterium]